MLPGSLPAVLILLVAVLPGSVYTWAYERQNSAYGAALSDRLLRFVAVSVLFHLVLAWAEFGVYRAALEGSRSLGWGEFSILWGGLATLVLVPAGIGTLLGGLYATRSERSGWTRIRRRLSADQESSLLKLALGRTPAPRAWDHLFSERPNVYLRVRVDSGGWIAGRFAAGSYAGGFPNETDLYLEEAWQVDQETGELGDVGLGFPVYIPAATIDWLDVIPEQAHGEEVDDE